MGRYVNKNNETLEFDFVVKFHGNTNFDPYRSRFSDLKNGVKQGFTCNDDGEGKCHENKIAQVNLLHDVETADTWEQRLYAFNFTLAEPGTDTPIEPFEEFFFDVQVMDLDTTLRPQPKMTKEIVCLDMQDFYFDSASEGTAIPSFNEFEDDDFSIMNKFDPVKRCDGGSVPNQHSCVNSEGVCSGNGCRSCTGSVSVKSDAIGFECDNPVNIQSRQKRISCQKCRDKDTRQTGNAKDRCAAPTREFRGMCVASVTPSSPCEQIARDAAMALEIAPAMDMDTMAAKIDEQLEAARNACGAAEMCEWGVTENRFGLVFNQGCFAAEATPAQCRAKSEAACNGNCKWSPANVYVISLPLALALTQNHKNPSN